MSKIDRLRWALSTVIAVARLRARKVDVGRDCRFLGQPIVTQHPNSRISIGERLVATSQSSGTALGVRGPVILRTLVEGASLVIGNDNGMSGTVICAATSVQIGSRCLFGADSRVFDMDFHNRDPGRDRRLAHRYSRPDWPAISAPLVIGDDVFIGARTIVCKGLTIGTRPSIATGSIVTQDVPESVLVAGVLARTVGEISPKKVGASA